MRNTDFMNLSLPEGADKIDVEILNSDFTAIENLLKQHAIIETMTLNGEGVIIDAIGPYIRLQNIDAVQVSIDIGNKTYTLASDENVIIRETAQNIGVITSGNVHITYFVNPKTYADKEFYTKEKVDELLVEATIEVDTELSEMSENPVQNKVITQELASYATTAEMENKVTEKVAEIVAGAPEDFDTLKEMSDWLTEHEDSATAMNSNIQKNAEDIAAANTNIQKNVDDIAATKNDVAINRTTLGTQCKNLFYYPDTATPSTYRGLEFSWKDNALHITGVATETADSYIPTHPFTTAGSQFDFKEDSIMSIVVEGTHERLSIHLHDGTVDKYHGLSNTTEIRITAGSVLRGIYIRSEKGVEFNTIYKIMIRNANITDSTYEPYTPSLQEQIKSLLARIEALEGATATTEGGE